MYLYLPFQPWPALFFVVPFQPWPALFFVVPFQPWPALFFVVPFQPWPALFFFLPLLSHQPLNSLQVFLDLNNVSLVQELSYLGVYQLVLVQNQVFFLGV